MYNGCNPTALCPLIVNSTATCDLYQKTSVLIPSNVQIYRQVLLNDAKILKETKTALYKLLPKYDAIPLKNDNDIE